MPTTVFSSIERKYITPAIFTDRQQVCLHWDSWFSSMDTVIFGLFRGKDRTQTNSARRRRRLECEFIEDLWWGLVQWPCLHLWKIKSIKKFRQVCISLRDRENNEMLSKKGETGLREGGRSHGNQQGGLGTREWRWDTAGEREEKTRTRSNWGGPGNNKRVQLDLDGMENKKSPFPATGNPVALYRLTWPADASSHFFWENFPVGMNDDLPTAGRLSYKTRKRVRRFPRSLFRYLGGVPPTLLGNTGTNHIVMG